MHTFEITDEFMLDGAPFKIMSGAVHYFRVHPSDWRHVLYNLKALGFNTVETYVPWNAHEPQPNRFDFSGILDLEAFLDLAAELGLWAIVRPSPFICAEWEFGGLPAWLLAEPGLRPRSSDPAFLERVAFYYDELMPRLVPRQVTQGGNILMMQVENEYGSYGEERAYLREMHDLMRERGVDVPLFTSDGPWRATLRAGSLIDDGVLATGNFGSRAPENFAQMQAFFDEHGRRWPLMCMEFWDGWFNRWGEKVIRRDPDELAASVREVLERGSINLYMFVGGTNFGFMNGCSARLSHDLHQVTSYDYDAVLDEAGNPTPKYDALAAMLREQIPGIEQAEPLVKPAFAPAPAPLGDRVGLLNTLDALAKPRHATYPKTMEELGQSTGYVLYRTEVERDAADERYRVIDGRDRVQVFLNGELLGTQYQEEVGEDLFGSPHEGINRIDVLVENMGRVNYGHKLLADSQRKGIRTGVTADLHFVTGWDMYPLPLDDVSRVDFSAGWQEGQPSFARFEFDLGEDESRDTYLDMRGFGKGCAFVNGFNVGRFWDRGPIRSLYVPHGLLKRGRNEVTVFETEGVVADELRFSATPVIDGEDTAE